MWLFIFLNSGCCIEAYDEFGCLEGYFNWWGRIPFPGKLLWHHQGDEYLMHL
jgi:hypothetical protein